MRIKNACSTCGHASTLVQSVFASRSFPLRCSCCGKRQFRRHGISTVLGGVVGFIGSFGTLLLFMAYGLKISFVVLLVSIVLVLATYTMELFLNELIGFTELEKHRTIKKSKENVWFAVIIMVVGAMLYILDV